MGREVAARLVGAHDAVATGGTEEDEIRGGGSEPLPSTVHAPARVGRRPAIRCAPTGEAKGSTVDSGVERAIERSRGKGRPLPDGVRETMEREFSADFGKVSVHTDGNADRLGRRLNARGFAVGEDIFFRRGEFLPGRAEGTQVLAHELTHVVQQRGEGPRGVSTLRRLVGFELEISLPASKLDTALDQGGVGGENAADTGLRQYLTGSAAANTMIHDFRVGGEDWYVVADHAEPGTAIDRARERINTELVQANQNNPAGLPQFIGPAGEIRPRVAILEYVTDPFDTQTPNGLFDMAEAILHLAANMETAVNRIANGQQAPPPLASPAWYVGIPPVNDWVNFGVRYNVPDQTMRGQFRRVATTVSQEINPQVTAGLLPENIPAFFREARREGLTTGQESALAFREALSQLRVTHAHRIAQAALRRVAQNHAIAYGEPTTGFVTLLTQYVFGTFLDATVQFEISKNLPIFLSKTDLSAAQATIQTVAERPGSWILGARNDLIDELWTRAANRYNRMRPRTRVDGNTEGAFTKADARSILTNPNPALNPADMFTVGTLAQPGVVDRPLGLDPHRVGNVQQAGREIPLEFRALARVARPRDLAAWAARMVGLLNRVNQ